MKNQLFLVLSLLVFEMSFSQTGSDKKGTPGIVAGWNSATVGVKDSDVSADPASGFYVGILWEQKLAPLFRLQSGIKYNKNGYTYGNIPGYDRTVLNYLSVPLALKVKVGPIYGIGGVYGAYRMGSVDKYSNGNDIKISTDDIKRMDFGGSVGLGFQILIIGIEARYNFGLSNVNAGEVGKYNNRYLELGAHVKLGK